MRKNKGLIIFIILIYMSITIIPFINFLSRREKEEIKTEEFAPDVFETSSEVDTTKFVLHDIATDEIISVSEKDFLIGSLASEMSVNVKEEALKAQCVASYSYYSYLREQNKDQKFQIEFNSNNNQVYTNADNLKTLWADKYNENYDYFNQIIDSVYGEKIMYNGEIACSSFFTVSNGITQSALDMWGKDIPYLVSVASPYDTYADGIESTVEYTPAQVKEILKKNWDYAVLDYTIPYSDWFSQIDYTSGACVMSVNVCGFGMTGDELRKAFCLSSPCFEINYDGTKFIFKSKGQGSFVGMSKTGASYMANEGASYEEILSWYFKKTTIEKADN